ncbi:ABC transporter permease [Dactylosporangium sp. NPDC000521]|uniref:ABC transporter permease n=1 Tax=Dactylosporangium sp. NPDC000521 TaxID=3363975 RepID=UPI0036B7DCCE
MFRYVVKRLGMSALTLAGILVVVFAITRILPGDAAAARLGPEATQADIAALRHEYGLDKPLLDQFVDYLRNVAQGDLGRSVATGQSVTTELLERLPATLELTVAALLLGSLIGFPLGFLGALRRGRWADAMVRVFAVLGNSVALFWLGLLLVYFLFFKLQVFPPPVGRLPIGVEPPPHRTGLYVVDGLLAGQFDTAGQALQQLALPALTLAIGVAAPILKMVRSSMIQSLASDYVRAATALGVPRWRVVLVDGLRNAMLPVLTVVGIVVGFLIGGNVIVEFLFSWPGMGRYAYDGLQSNDLEVLQGFVVVVGVIYILLNLAIDLLYSVIDPRIRVGGKNV